MNGVTRWDPFQELQSWGERMSRLIGSERAPARRGNEEESLAYGTWMPPVDIVEGKDKIQLKVELPGFKENQVNLTVEDGLLTIRGERKFNRESNEENYHRIERSYGTFVRSFTLPNSVEQNRIQATFSDGILNVDMPKREETKPKQIQIKAGTAEGGSAAGRKKEIDVQKA
jgi:HSP20 family protein